MIDQTFCLPDLGEGLTDAVISGWLVAIGETVVIDQVVVEVETAKASVEVPVPFAGIVTALHADAGSTIPVGSPLITVQGTGPSSGPIPTEADAHERYRTEERAGSGNVLIGYGTSEAPARRRRRPARSRQAAAVAGARVISPVIRKLARDNGIDVTTLTPSGPGAVITRADIERALTQPADTPATQRIPITGVRRVIGEKLSTSRREIPDATTWVDVDATALLDARRVVHDVARRKVSLLALLARLAVAALREYPELNSSVDTERSEIVRHAHINLGIAMQTSRGLMVPVIERADAMDTLTLSDALTEMTGSARDGKLAPARLSGGTFTLNNYGVFGVDGSTSIINHPEAAILGIGRIIDRPWVIDGELVIRKLAQVSLSFDHRVCDGGSAGGFLRLFADLVENPVAALARL
ncbi:MAG TPA: dihydrolipoamide acetyltransferase family protein [Mycobacterium sp.]|nr:dihydrolipoamide acetyltransferase family protein [Mycobacterium sp.]